MPTCATSFLHQQTLEVEDESVVDLGGGADVGVGVVAAGEAVLGIGFDSIRNFSGQ